MSYYFISIGGSGSKVTEALTHLCAAGMMPDREALYVMAIDPDTGNGNLTRSKKVMQAYETVQSNLCCGDSGIFKPLLHTMTPFPWEPVAREGSLNGVFERIWDDKKVIGQLCRALYTEAEWKMKLNEGFRGHPAAGAAVMAQMFDLEQGEPWRRFRQLVETEAKNGQVAKIFLAGSIFGGTGAAGMPTISKLLRDAFRDLFQQKRVFLGGLLILPFFKFIEKKEQLSEGELYAQAENFTMQTKAALKYYSSRKVVEENYDTMYFLGGELTRTEDFSVGSKTQENKAHIVELLGALAAIDFFQSTPNRERKCAYIARKNPDCFCWDDLPKVKNTSGEMVLAKLGLSQFCRFAFVYVYLIQPVLEAVRQGKVPLYQYPWYVDYMDGVDPDDEGIKAFHDYINHFIRWIMQVQNVDSETGKVNFFDSQAVAWDSQKDAPIFQAEFFRDCIVGDSQKMLDFNEIWLRLAERKCRDRQATRFGKLLRVIYDSCI